MRFNCILIDQYQILNNIFTFNRIIVDIFINLTIKKSRYQDSGKTQGGKKKLILNSRMTVNKARNTNTVTDHFFNVITNLPSNRF